MKLDRLPERVPLKLTVMVAPELHDRLTRYAAYYAESYGREEPLAELIPAMLSSFLESDRDFARRPKS